MGDVGDVLIQTVFVLWKGGGLNYDHGILSCYFLLVFFRSSVLRQFLTNRKPLGSEISPNEKEDIP